MTNPVAIIRHITDGDKQYDAIMFWCPGCEYEWEGQPTGGLHMLPVNTSVEVTQWTWDGNLEAPTLSPSILSRHNRVNDPEFICHSFLNAGIFDFLGDCTHQFAGQKVPMVPLPDWVL